MWSRDVAFPVSSLPTGSLLGWVIPLQQGFNLEWPECKCRLCLFIFSPNVGLFLADYYCDEGICMSPENYQQAWR